MSTVPAEHPAAARAAALATRFTEELGERVLSADVAYDQLTVTVAAEHWPQVVRYCRQQLGMAFFDWLSAVDEREAGFAVVAHVYNHITREGVLLRAAVPGGRDEPRFPTVTDVYRGANWHEREAYDMFGIVFEGHPGLLPRIFTVENFEGWPLRKEFKLATRVVKPWPGAKEPGEPGEEEGGASATTAAPAAAPGTDPEDRAAAAKAKAERAKAKAAEARKRKAAEKAAAQADENPTGSESAVSAPQPEGKAAAQGGAPVDPAADAEPDPGTPEGAAEIAGTAIAKDAAAGTTAGHDLASGEQPGSDQPQRDPEREAELAEGGPAQDGGTPGVEREGIHDLADSTVREDVSDQPVDEPVEEEDQP